MNNIEAAGAAGKKKKKSFFGTLGRQWQLLVMSLPMLIYVLIFNYGPMWGWITAFQDYKPKLGITGSKFVGLKNFKWLFGRDDFLNSVRNTLAMSVINLVLGTVAAIVLAILLNEVMNTLFKRTVQTVTYLPHFLSMVIVVGMAQNIFASNGPINQLLQGIGQRLQSALDSHRSAGLAFWLIWQIEVLQVGHRRDLLYACTQFGCQLALLLYALQDSSATLIYLFEFQK